ncbi:MAG: hypothetical protein K2X01_10940 [Cyanobacteria bacterium]|nr:hypothetical protein [Cyanobacteriota bacterium]
MTPDEKLPPPEDLLCQDVLRPFFHGRRLLIATQHGKEQVLLPILERGLGVRCDVTTGFDTDAFGTFSGERHRSGDALETARLKAEAVKQHYPEATLILTSEGSFGPSPQMPWAAADTELLYLWDSQWDRQNQGVWTAVFHTLETNYVSFVDYPSPECPLPEYPSWCSSWESLLEMTTAWGFPSHGVILGIKHVSGEGFSKIYKGIQDPVQLKQLFVQYSPDHQIRLSPDMRACFNPTRMRAIAACAEQLVTQLSILCPECAWPGFQQIKLIDALPCEACGLPTRLPASALWQCQHCQFQKKQPIQTKLINEENQATANPRDCEFCNP